MDFVRTMVVAALWMTLPLAASAVEIIHYDNKPTPVALIAGDERTLQFGDHVAVGTTPSQDALFRVQSAQGALHILAYAPFEQQRIQVKRLGDGRILLFDVSAESPSDDGATLEDIAVYMPDENIVKRQSESAEQAHATAATPQSSVDITPITLTRYVAQRFYAPQRLHREHQGITAQSLGDFTERALRVFSGATAVNTQVSAVSAYRGGRYHLSRTGRCHESACADGALFGGGGP